MNKPVPSPDNPSAGRVRVVSRVRIGEKIAAGIKTTSVSIITNFITKLLDLKSVKD